MNFLDVFLADGGVWGKTRRVTHSARWPEVSATGQQAKENHHANGERRSPPDGKEATMNGVSMLMSQVGQGPVRRVVLKGGPKVVLGVPAGAWQPRQVQGRASPPSGLPGGKRGVGHRGAES